MKLGRFSCRPTLCRVALCTICLFPLHRAIPSRAERPAGHLTAGREMTVPRADHTAMLMPDMKVLIAGGRDDHGVVLAGTEIYDPTAQTFSSAFKLLVPRQGHIAAALGDGKLLFAGGRTRSGASLASTEDYDFENAKSSHRGDMHARRYHPTATMLQDGRVLVCGGEDGSRPLDSAETYNLLNGTWKLVGRMTAARVNHTATLLSDGRVLIAGGSGLHGNILASTEIFDSHTNKFTAARDLHEPRFSHTAARMLDGKVLLAGGAHAVTGDGLMSAEIFDSRTNDFAPAPNLPGTHMPALPDSPVLLDGRVLIMGGAKAIDVYDPNARTFQSASGNFDKARSRSAAIQLQDGSVRIFGGADFQGVSTAQSWIYQPERTQP